jgi:hypothetical protein
LHCEIATEIHLAQLHILWNHSTSAMRGERPIDVCARRAANLRNTKSARSERIFLFFRRGSRSDLAESIELRGRGTPMRYLLAAVVVFAIGAPTAQALPSVASKAVSASRAEFISTVAKRAPAKSHSSRRSRSSSTGGIHPLVGSGDY